MATDDDDEDDDDGDDEGDDYDDYDDVDATPCHAMHVMFHAMPCIRHQSCFRLQHQQHQNAELSRQQIIQATPAPWSQARRNARNDEITPTASLVRKTSPL